MNKLPHIIEESNLNFRYVNYVILLFLEKNG